MLTRHIRRVLWHPNDARNTCRIHNARALAVQSPGFGGIAHGSDLGAQAVQYTTEVDVEYKVPVWVGDVFDVRYADWGLVSIEMSGHPIRDVGSDMEKQANWT
jgi:hypothetical protein